MVVKDNINSLAIFGGLPAFQDKLHVGRPNIGNRSRLLERINHALDTKWLTNYGPYVQEFEQKIAEATGAKYCIAMCNGTTALEIAIRALGLSGEVILPSFTFVATAHALEWHGITPVFCDIDPETWTLNPIQVERLITPRTTAVMGVHLWGRACDVDSLTKIARRHDLKILFDAAHAFGCSYKKRMIGSFGDAEVFSFHATKILNTFEGGAVVTNDDGLATKIRLISNFGFSGYDRVIACGTNGKMNEVSAAMGLSGLESLEEFITTNHSNYRCYQQELKGVRGIHLMTYGESEKSNYQYIVLELDEQSAGLNRDQFVEILHAENVLVRRYFYPGCHRMEPYRSDFPSSGFLLSETERLAARVLVLPTGTSIGPSEITVICQIIRFILNNSRQINERRLHLVNSST